MARDARNRAADAAPEIAFALSREPLADALLRPLAEGALVERATHNDTKLNNVLFDEAAGEGLCVVDLDTVMPGLFLYDFGDMVRSAVSPSAEDERDLSKVGASEAVFEALVRGTVRSSATAFRPPTAIVSSSRGRSSPSRSGSGSFRTTSTATSTSASTARGTTSTGRGRSSRS